MNNLISQSEAARIAGISRQGMSSLKKAGTYNFFIEDGKKVKIDIDHQDWKSYLHERKTNGNNSVKNNVVKAEKKKTEPKATKKKTVKKSSIKATAKPKAKSKAKSKKKKESERQKNSLNGGVDLANYVPQNIADVKRLTEIQKLNLEMRVRLGELIEKEMVISILNEIGQNIQSHFVDLPRRVSELICQKLERVGMEKEVEQIISDPFEVGIKSLKLVCQKTTKVEYD